MSSPTPDWTAVVERLEKLERQNRRMKQVGAVALIIAAAVLLMGQASPNRTVEANEFVLQDESGAVHGRFGLVDTVDGWRPERPSGTGHYAAFLEFEDGTPATLTYNGYGFFDSVELTTWGADKGREGRVKFRKALLNKEVDEEAGKESTRFGTKGERIVVVGGREGRPWLPGNLGLFILSFDEGDVRMSPKGLFVYDSEGVREIEVQQPGGEGMSLDSEVMELYNAVKHDQPLFHDGHWGMATAEVQWAILESAQQRSEVLLKYQVPVPQGF